MAQLLNEATAKGTYQEIETHDTTKLSVELSALRVTKTADKDLWVKENLTYTIVITNIDIPEFPGDPLHPGLPVTAISLTDIIEPTIATLVPGSVTIDGESAAEPEDYTYNAETGLLSFPDLSTLTTGQTRTIIFSVSHVQP